MNSATCSYCGFMPDSTPPCNDAPAALKTDRLAALMTDLRAFVDERDWGQFHTPRNLATSIAIEAGELLEHFQWDDGRSLDEARLELADVLTYCLQLAHALDEDPVDLVRRKLEITQSKYPVEKAKGRSDRYDQL